VAAAVVVVAVATLDVAAVVVAEIGINPAPRS
jgi:hypothetical protein